MIKYFKVTVKGGHVGRGKYIPLVLPIFAENGKEAARKARWFPRVKHHHKDAILSCEEIIQDEYVYLQIKNQQDPYFMCKSIQDQNILLPNLYHQLYEEEKTIHSRKEVVNTKKIRYFTKLNKDLINIINKGIIEWYEQRGRQNMQLKDDIFQ